MIVQQTCSYVENKQTEGSLCKQYITQPSTTLIKKMLTLVKFTNICSIIQMVNAASKHLPRTTKKELCVELIWDVRMACCDYCVDHLGQMCCFIVGMFPVWLAIKNSKLSKAAIIQWLAVCVGLILWCYWWKQIEVICKMSYKVMCSLVN